MSRKKDKITDTDYLDPQFQKGMRYGIRCTASFVADWESQIASNYRMEDIILGKFNLIAKEKMRRK